MALNDVESIREIPDAMERLKAAHHAIDTKQEQINQLAVVRRNAIEDCIAAGVTPVKISDAIGISRSRVSQLRSAGTKPERLFLGSGQLTIAIGGKPEQGRTDDASKFVVSKEALSAFEVLADTARSLGLDAVSETVPPPGLVDLNRPNLIVLCSPRLLPFIGQVLAADPHLGFQEDQKGWFLLDKTSGVEHRSPRDANVNADCAYIGRLPRPDGQGTFLYLAGIHAEGTLGAAHWLAANLHDLHKELKVKRFSTLVSAEFDPKSGSIMDVERLTPIYRQDA